MRKLFLVFVVGFGIGQLDPIGGIAWRALEARLPAMKTASLAAESPFDRVPPSEWIAESPNAYAIRDTYAPTAPVHVLVVPKARIPTLLDAPSDVLGEMLDLARRVAEETGIADSGFRIVINTNPQGGQTVYHLHLHVLGGHQNREPLLPILGSRLRRILAG